MWDHNSVYSSLLKKGNYEKRGDLDKYVSLDHQGLRSLNSILYKSGSRYERAPVHINKGRSSFSEGFFEKTKPALKFVSPGSHDWEQYKVIDWDKFAKGLSLEMETKAKREKSAIKKSPQPYEMVRESCIRCFKQLGAEASFKKNGNVIRCMKEKSTPDWPEDWVEWTVENAGDIIKGVEV